MAPRYSDVPLLILSLALSAQGSTCPSTCPPCPAALSCFAPDCPPPVCPPLPAIPPCPSVRCPTLPDVPACPTPVLHLSCPHASCAPQSCPSCPACPNAPSCPACSSPSTPSPSPPPPPSRTLPSGYTYVPGSGAYKHFSDPESWGGANTTCSQDGGYLAVPKTQEELMILLRYMETSFMHVGFKDEGEGDSFSDQSWVSVLGQPADETQRSMWDDGIGCSLFSSGDCAYLSEGVPILACEDCDDAEEFVCEIPYP